MTRAIRRSRVCYNCAMPIIDMTAVVCPRCGCGDIDSRRARPKQYIARKAANLPHPWGELLIRHGGTVLLTGGPGSGKTTITTALKPKVISSSEQEVDEVAAVWFRVNPGLESPLLTSCENGEELAQDLMELGEGEIGVCDSVSQLASGGRTAEIMRDAIFDVRKRGAIVFFVTQRTKDGDMLGPNELRHLVDVVAEIPDDDAGGMRRLSVNKNRFGPLSSTYFSLTESGVKVPEFPNAYSVEGPPGKYSLALYPSGSTKWSGILETFDKARIISSKTASCARVSAVYETGFVEPDDVKERQKFAERHGLNWISAREAFEKLEEHRDAKALKKNNGKKV